MPVVVTFKFDEDPINKQTSYRSDNVKHGLFFLNSKAGNSKENIPRLYVVRLYVVVICKFDKGPIKNKQSIAQGEIWAFYH